MSNCCCFHSTIVRLCAIRSHTQTLGIVTAHASIIGDQHFMTFDKRFFEFAGECSYLLARDFIDGNFSVVVNYARARDHVTRKSITVLSGAAQFEVMPDGRVKMNGERTEMPMEAGNLAIRRHGNVITVSNKLVDICSMLSLLLKQLVIKIIIHLFVVRTWCSLK